MDEHCTVLRIYLQDLKNAKTSNSLGKIQHQSALIRSKLDTMTKLVIKDFDEKLSNAFKTKLAVEIGNAKNEVEQTQTLIDMVISLSGDKNVGASASSPFTQKTHLRWNWTPILFHGKPAEWTTWWDVFRSAIHDNADILPEFKMKALTDCLKGAADEVLGKMARTGDNYEEAIKLLQARYGNPVILSATYYDQLSSLPPAADLKSQRKTLDKLSAIVRNLNALRIQIPIDDQAVIKGIMNKFPTDLMRSTLIELRRKNECLRFSPNEIIAALDEALQIDDFIATYCDQPQPLQTSTAPIEFKQGGTFQAPAVKRKQEEYPCVFCNAKHKSSACKRYATISSRKDRLYTLGKCSNCLKKNHESSRCRRSPAQCKLCQGSHNTALCCVRRNSGMLITYSASFLQTFICVINNNSKSLEIRGLLDPGSTYSYITQDIVKALELPSGASVNFECSRFNDPNSIIIPSKEVDVCLTNQHNQKRKFRVNTTLCITGELFTAPSPTICSQILPPEYDYADYDIMQEKQRPIKILIGADIYFSVVDVRKVRELPGGVKLLHSFFGWVPAGGLRSNTQPTVKKFCTSMLTSHLSTTSHKDETQTDSKQNLSDSELILDDKIEMMWSLEMLGIENPSKQASLEYVIEYYRKTTFAEPSGRINVRIPWRNLKAELPSNFRIALARLRQLLNSTPHHVIKQGNELIHEQLQVGITEFAPPQKKALRAYHSDEPSRLHYLPHQWIFQKNKLRIVSDGSAKTKSGLSLNDHIFPGPNLTKNIVKLLLNFRLNPIGLVADIEKAYLQMSLNEVDRDATRFLWLKDIDKPATPDNLLYLRFARVPFGLNVSPCLLNMTLQETFGVLPTNKWLLQAKEKFYVDNYVNSVSSPIEALELYEALSERLGSIQMNLRDWATNEASIASALPTEKLDKTEGALSVLGLLWCRKLDQLSIKLNSESSIIATKKNILSFLASIYDPLGLIAPCILELKLLVQKCWKIKYEWKAVLPPQLTSEWLKLHSDALQIPKVQLFRRYWNFEETAESYSLNIFCDASQKAYACCAYLLHTHKSKAEYASQLIFTKTRIAPMKLLTIPKLELMAVVLGVRTAQFLQENLEIKLAKVTLWTDATTVLQWITSTEVLPPFIQNRVSEIRKASLFINYVPTADNPADLATRGKSASAIQNEIIWWKGPRWLLHERLWPKPPINVENCSLPLHTRQCTALTVPSKVTSALLTKGIENKFLTWKSRVRTYYFIIKFCFLGSNLPFNASDVEAMNMAERLLIIELQRKYFQKEYHLLKQGKHPSNDLDLFLDNKGIIRCKGRLHYAKFPWEVTHPILLPRESPATFSYIKEIHTDNAHIGVSHTLAKLRERVWITKARAKVKSVIHRCYQCRYWEGGHYSLPPIPPLPEIRLREVVPFLQVGIDYFGPLHIKNALGDDTVDVNVLLITCLVTRAVHLELVPNLSGEQFIWAMERFCSIRRVPKMIISDNASTFTFVQPLVGIKVRIKDHKVNSMINSNRIEWYFIPQYAPWYGGAYERLVGLVKRCLKKSYGKILLGYIELQTVLYKTADIINSRPLSYVSSEEIVEPLTPNHFLKLGPTNINLMLEPVPKPMASDTGSTLIKNWQIICRILDGYWDAFRHLYLLSLRERHTVLHPKKKGEAPFRPAVGDVVLIQETTMPRAYWKLGKIEKLDVRQAIAYVRSQGKLLIRSIKLLYPLEVAVERQPQAALQPKATGPQPLINDTSS